MGKTIKVAVPLGAILLLLAVPAFADSLAKPEKMYWFAGSLPGTLFQQGYGISFVQDIPEADLGPVPPNCSFPALEVTVCSPLPDLVIPGDVVLLEDITLGQDISNWSDVLRFGEPPFAELTTLATLYSDGWGDFATLLPLSPNVIFIQETIPPTVYVAPPNTYLIWSDAPEHLVPEPSALALLGTSLLGLLPLKGRLRLRVPAAA